MPQFDLIVIGGGVVGTFHAYHAARRGLYTLLIERDAEPSQASVRNFGMVIPSGMKPGIWHERGLRSAAIYRQVHAELDLPLFTGGSQYVASTAGEERVLAEFAQLAPPLGYECRLHSADESRQLNPALSPRYCRASLHFPGDLRVEPRTLVAAISEWLEGELLIDYRPQTTAVGVETSSACVRVRTSKRDEFTAQHVVVASGCDLQTLFPDVVTKEDFLYCQLQMLCTEPQPGVKLGASLASGLSLRRYDSFAICQSREELSQTEPLADAHRTHGIHLLFAQDAEGRLIVGDSHHLGFQPPPEEYSTQVEEAILDYARLMLDVPHWKVERRWLGRYMLHASRDFFETTLDERIHLITALGGKGMTTAPALGQETIERLFGPA